MWLLVSTVHIFTHWGPRSPPPPPAPHSHRHYHTLLATMLACISSLEPFPITPLPRSHYILLITMLQRTDAAIHLDPSTPTLPCLQSPTSSTNTWSAGKLVSTKGLTPPSLINPAPLATTPPPPPPPPQCPPPPPPPALFHPSAPFKPHLIDEDLVGREACVNKGVD
jgi:hypothetical protein